MANAVEICNLALGHLGSEANVASINPPDGSVEAGYCARYFPFARKVMLTMFEWNFASTRKALAPVANASELWEFAYAQPADCLKPWAILKAGAVRESDSADFVIEGGVIYTNEPIAILRYTRDITDTTKYTPQFDSALSWLLASYLAGPIIKGPEGSQASLRFLERARSEGSSAAAVNANSSSTVHGDQLPAILAARV